MCYSCNSKTAYFYMMIATGPSTGPVHALKSVQIGLLFMAPKLSLLHHKGKCTPDGMSQDKYSSSRLHQEYSGSHNYLLPCRETDQASGDHSYNHNLVRGPVTGKFGEIASEMRWYVHLYVRTHAPMLTIRMDLSLASRNAQSAICKTSLFFSHCSLVDVPTTATNQRARMDQWRLFVGKAPYLSMAALNAYIQGEALR